MPSSAIRCGRDPGTLARAVLSLAAGQKIHRLAVAAAGLVEGRQGQLLGRSHVVEQDEEVDVAVLPGAILCSAAEQDDLDRVEVGDDAIQERLRHQLGGRRTFHAWHRRFTHAAQ
jgi:hypothetical protein